MSAMPDSPWKNLSIDFYGPSSNGVQLLVVIDEYSRYPIVKKVHSTAESHVLPIIHEIIATFGIPRVIKSDNGPPFNGKEFERFCNTHTISAGAHIRTV